MPSRSVTHSRVAQLNRLGEEEVFGKYLEPKMTVNELMNFYFEPHGEASARVTSNAFYKWLDAEEGRKERWDKVKKIKGHDLSEQALKEALDATERTVKTARLKNTALNTRAMQLNSDLNPMRPPQTTVNVQANTQVNVGQEWLEAVLATENRVSTENPVQPENRVSPENVEFEIVDDDVD